ncbi:ribonuclease activity regulator RraA [Falsiroseomonas sp.]|uniref:ribonuclease activity regulator RraA n=1 Tax=Falsiroseomonas sp. TaxID=2870721 RepID=UPI00271A82A1|nr:ribonuclease activity regulator RraA [Falsiroseomonas sp.]MDO9501239.1 ribonuclease activity regulator RraA [Falsiroseomonas sp.]MDP3415671.1 ribonuclease activity regulator RraA [Falsiroseomonas sp.]
MTPAQRDALLGVTTATLTTVLLKKGVRFCYIAGSRPLVPGPTQRIVGPAFTLRFTPTREDLATVDSWASPTSTRAAIEAMPEGAVAVADAMGSTAAGIFGDILCARMAKKGVAGLVTDGMVRDGAGVIGTGLPVFCQGYVAPASVAALNFVGWQETIGCGGVTVVPGDIVVADQDGAVVIPAALLDAVVDAAVEQERLEAWIMVEVGKGVALPGLYPANAETKARYEADKAAGRA